MNFPVATRLQLASDVSSAYDIQIWVSTFKEYFFGLNTIKVHHSQPKLKIPFRNYMIDEKPVLYSVSSVECRCWGIWMIHIF